MAPAPQSQYSKKAGPTLPRDTGAQSWMRRRRGRRTCWSKKTGMYVYVLCLCASCVHERVRVRVRVCV
eukprot:1161222-Pelagomonas_calceolata.AAC.17